MELQSYHQSITGSELRWSLYLPVARDNSRLRFHLGPWPSNPLSLCSSSGKLEMSDSNLVQNLIQMFYSENQKQKLKVYQFLSWLWIHMQIHVNDHCVSLEEYQWLTQARFQNKMTQGASEIREGAVVKSYFYKRGVDLTPSRGSSPPLGGSGGMVPQEDFFLNIEVKFIHLVHFENKMKRYMDTSQHPYETEL